MSTKTQKIPLTIGITGHRDLREEERDVLRKSVRNIFQLLHEHYPNSPLQLLSPLAEGADCLVAEVALTENVQLLVPLPMPQDLYITDFQSPIAKQKFTEQLKQATQVFELALVEGNTHTNISQDQEARNKQYALVGAYIASHSHILLALWNGISLGKSGGTSEVVQFKLTGDMQDLPKQYELQHGFLAMVNTGTVFHVTANRKSGKLLNVAGETRVLLPNHTVHLQDWHSSDLDAIDRFNQDIG